MLIFGQIFSKNCYAVRTNNNTNTQMVNFLYLFKLRRVKWGQSPIRTRLTRRSHGPGHLFGVWNLEWVVFDVQILRQFNNTEVFVHSLFQVQLRSHISTILKTPRGHDTKNAEF